MRFFSVLLSGMLLFTSAGWENDMESAKKKAEDEHKMILLNFSGSDWCGPCIRMRKEIFESESFRGFAEKNLVLVNADFPRLKKNQLPKDQLKKNEKLADKYNPNGSFPLTALLDVKGHVLKTWEGYPNCSPEQFVAQLKAYTDARN